MSYELNVKLIFMGTPKFAVPTLSRLLEDNHRIATVFTQPDRPAGRGNRIEPSPVKAFAIQHQLLVHQPAKIRDNQHVREEFERIRPDVCVVVAYGKILPEWLLRIPQLGCINVHASLLPRYRGAAPINWAIANGESQTGITIMQMDAGMDTGPIFATRAIEIGSDQTATELAAELSVVGADLLAETLPRIEAGELTPQKQDDTQASYAPMLKREDGIIDWRLTAREISNRVRAFQPWPGTYTFLRGERLILWRAHEIQLDAIRLATDSQSNPLEASASDSIGRIAEIGAGGFTVYCAGASALAVEEVQPEGKRRMSARDFVSGARLKPGELITDRRPISSAERLI